MTTTVDIVNRALQVVGTRTAVTSSELANETTNEAIQANLALEPIRKQLLRMAPWTCGLKTEQLVYITSLPGTAENSSAGTNQWARGLPSPPWIYEYQYPVDCLNMAWITPISQTGFSSSVPITPAINTGVASYWQGAPVKFAVQNDQFYPVTAAAVAAGGTGYAVGDIITLAGTPTGDSPIGAPVKLEVATLSGSAVATVTVVSQVLDAETPIGGSYFARQTNPVAQGSTTGSGTGATFNLTFGALAPQRVILTNQEQAVAVYVQDVTDPNVMDPEFQETWVKILGATLAMALTGDKKLANMRIAEANVIIERTRADDAGEGLTINDVTPDWIRVRGVSSFSPYSGPSMNYDWGGLWPVFG